MDLIFLLSLIVFFGLSWKLVQAAGKDTSAL